ncbi:hypothetical protein YC2023_023877 [Brassica napus]
MDLKFGFLMFKEIRERLERFRVRNITFFLQPFESKKENVLLEMVLLMLLLKLILKLLLKLLLKICIITKTEIQVLTTTSIDSSSYNTKHRFKFLQQHTDIFFTMLHHYLK